MNVLPGPGGANKNYGWPDGCVIGWLDGTSLGMLDGCPLGASLGMLDGFHLPRGLIVELHAASQVESADVFVVVAVRRPETTGGMSAASRRAMRRRRRREETATARLSRRVTFASSNRERARRRALLPLPNAGDRRRSPRGEQSAREYGETARTRSESPPSARRRPAFSYGRPFHSPPAPRT